MGSALSPPRLGQLLERLSRRFSIARMAPERGEELHRFFQVAYRDQPNPVFRDPEQIRAQWRWATELHPRAGADGPAGWICLKAGRIVGYFGMTPAVAKAPGRETLVCWGRELIVAPEVRSGGVGPLLIQAALNGSRRPFLIAGLNPVSYALFRRMGFLDFGTIPLYIKVHNPLAALSLQAYRLFRRLSAPSVARPLSFEPLRAFDDRFDRWWKAIEQAVPCVIRRTSAEMNWRYFRHPRHRYTVLVALEGSRWKGVAVARHSRSKGLPSLSVTELLAHPRDVGVLPALLRETQAALEPSAPEPPVLTRCAVSCAVLERALLRAGFFRIPSAIHWMISSAEGPESVTPLARRQDWLINGGDSDLDVF